jgi:hypothetical protein
MHGSVAVIRSVQRAHNHRRGSRSNRDDDKVAHQAGRIAVEEEVRQRMARNAELPRIEGVLVENSRGLLGGESEQLRWVVLDPPKATLSIWDRLPNEANSAISGTNAHTTIKVPKKLYSVDKLVEVDFNPAFHKIFLRFEGASLCLAAPTAEEFHRWMASLQVYDANAVRQEVIRANVERAEAASRGASEERCRTRSCSPYTRGGSRERIGSRERLRRTPGSSSGSSIDFQTIFQKCYVAEPSPEPMPDDDGYSFYEDFAASKRSLEEYDPGSTEAKLVMTSMGLMDHTNGLRGREIFEGSEL